MSTTTAKKGDNLSPLLRAYVAIQELEARLDAAERVRREPIAIIGLGCRFPGGADPEAFWQLLAEGRDASGEIPGDRWERGKYYDPAPQTPGKAYTRRGGYLKDVANFDADFFGISEREAVSMDPQQRLLLEVAWEALENAGQAPDRLAGGSTGVFVGLMNLDYPQLLLTTLDPGEIDAYFGAGSELSFLSGRLSYLLGVHGPSMVVATACSSSLVAIHLACQSLRLGECDTALAGGVNLILNPHANVVLCKMNALGVDGRCKTFDASADGYARGEGCGMMVLKRLTDALANGDNIQAVIRGSAVNHGGPSGGLTVPSGPAQETVIRDALRAAGVEPSQIDYMEAHGTGTSLGDPIELRALAKVLGTERPEGGRCLVGSVKTNVGHLESAAGVAGLIKVVLALQHQQIPPHLHLTQPNPHIPWSELPLEVPTRLTTWPRGEVKRLAGISSFGLSGINAHLVVEEAPVVENTVGVVDRPFHLLSLSGQSEGALRELAGRWERHLSNHPGLSLADMAYTANTGRTAFHKRLAIVAQNNDQIRQALAAAAVGKPASGLMTYSAPEQAHPAIVFLFSGEGSQYVGMGQQLYETQAIFRQALERCAEILERSMKESLLSLLYPGAGSFFLLDEPAYGQPALFAIEYSLAQLWLSWGIQPTAVLGYGLGEYVAACVAGVISLEDSLRLVATRGRLLQELAQGAMAVVHEMEDRVREVLVGVPEGLAIAAINSPRQVVVSGIRSAVQAALTELERLGIRTEMQRGPYAFHSPLVQAIENAWEEALRQVTFHTPSISLISSLLGQPIRDEEVASIDYWQRQIREPVRFSDALQTLRQQGYTIFVEVGPTTLLLPWGKECVTSPESVWLPTLRPEKDDWLQLLESLQVLYVRGVSVDWTSFDKGYFRRRLPLPTYPFQRRRYWQEGMVPGARTQGSSSSRAVRSRYPLLGSKVRTPLKDTLFEASWSCGSFPWLREHQLQEEVVIAGACYLSVVSAAVEQRRGITGFDLEQIAFRESMVLPDMEERTVQLLVTQEISGRSEFQLYSTEAATSEGETSWSLHATGQILSRNEHQNVNGRRSVLLTELQQRCQEAVDVADFYQNLKELGIVLGPHFRWLEAIWRGKDEAIARLRKGSEEECAPAPIPPGLLDSCFHLVAAAMPLEERTTAYVPLGIDQLSWQGPVEGSLWAHARIRRDQSSANLVSADVHLFREDGQVVLSIVALHLKRVDLALLCRQRKPENDWLYQIEWQRAVREPQSAVQEANGRWLIFADHGGTGQKLAEGLRGRGLDLTVVVSGETEAIERLLQDMQALTDKPVSDIAFLWGVDEDPVPSNASLWDLPFQRSSGSLLNLVKAVLRWGMNSPRVWVVTRGAQVVGTREMSVSTTQATLWGFSRTLMNEHPAFRCILVDLDPFQQPSDEWQIDSELLEEILAPDGENQLAFRDGARHVPRLVTLPSLTTQEEHQAVRLGQGLPGELDSLSFRQADRRPPGAGEVEIAVHATGLNFRDVLSVLGMYPGEPGPLGGECAGCVVAVGSGVNNPAVGDEVVALSPGSFASFVTVSGDLVAPKPASLSFADAAALPVVFLTARFALQHLATIKAGERVLIHAAAGGVGLAAVQLCLRTGVEVFATAGTPEKRAILQALGVQHVYDSRSLTFAEEIQHQTGGNGVHVVLNSLAGEFIPRSLSVLAPEGRFVEIGKTEVWEVDRVHELRPDVHYHVFALDQLTVEDPVGVGTELRALLSEFANGSLNPLPRHIFVSEDVSRAFRFMAQAQHIGKIVVTQRNKVSAGTELRSTVLPHATYLITGGLGGLGFAVAQGLAEQGAKHLVLLGRRGPDAETQKAIAVLEKGGVEVVVAGADVSDQDELGKVLAEITDSLPPVRGIIHAAGVLDDGVIVEQTWDRFVRVFAPKVAGAWNLHWMTRHLSLDFFVLFSSAASILGSPGQANYAAANAFLDALAHHRRMMGLPALSINWGPWDEVGMAARGGLRANWGGQGIQMISPTRGVELFHHLRRSSATQVAVLPVDWQLFRKRLPTGAIRPVLTIEPDSQQQPAPASRVGVDLVRRLGEAPTGSRRDILTTFVTEQVVKLLGARRAEGLTPARPLQDHGLDSLMAVELRNTLGNAVGQTLPATLLFNYPTVASLVEYLLEAVLKLEVASIEQETKSGGVATRVLEEIEQISDEEVEQLLNKRLTEEMSK